MASNLRIRPAHLIAAAAILVLSACGASGGSEDASPSPSTSSQPADVATDGTAGGDADDDDETGDDVTDDDQTDQGGDAGSDDEFGVTIGDGTVGSGSFFLSGTIEDSFLHGIDEVRFETSGGCGGGPDEREFAASVAFVQEGQPYPFARIIFEAEPRGASAEGTHPADDPELEIYDEDGTLATYEGEGEMTLSDLDDRRMTVGFTGTFDTQGGPVDVEGSWVWLLPCT